MDEPRTTEPLREVSWEEARKSVKAPDRLSWSDKQAYWREHAHEVWEARNGWRYHVLKKYKKNEASDPYARWFCLVDGFESELGDVYVREVVVGGRRLK